MFLSFESCKQITYSKKEIQTFESRIRAIFCFAETHIFEGALCAFLCSRQWLLTSCCSLHGHSGTASTLQATSSLSSSLTWETSEAVGLGSISEVDGQPVLCSPFSLLLIPFPEKPGKCWLFSSLLCRCHPPARQHPTFPPAPLLVICPQRNQMTQKPPVFS